MDKVGIVLNSLFSSQLSYYALRNVNKYLSKEYLTNFIFFVRELVIPCIEPECGTMRWEELWGYDGHLITTDVESTRKAMMTPGPKSITFYAYDIDWFRRLKNSNPPRYEDFASIYQNPNIKIVARNEEYKKLIEGIWNIKVAGVVDDFNMEQMLEIVGAKNDNK